MAQSIRLASDLHLEFNGGVDLANFHRNDTLILAGDICEYRSHRTYLRPLIEEVCDEYDNVLMVAGNHEYYGSSFAETEEALRELGVRHSNFHFLQKDTITLDGVRYAGATLWTDLNRGDPQAVFDSRLINDYFCIADFNENLWLDLNRDHHEWLTKQVNSMLPPHVIITHHSPEIALRDRAKWGDGSQNYSFHSTNCRTLFDEQLEFWFYGHTHMTQTVEIMGVTFAVNAHGYGYQENAQQFYNVNNNFFVVGDDYASK